MLLLCWGSGGFDGHDIMLSPVSVVSTNNIFPLSAANDQACLLFFLTRYNARGTVDSQWPLNTPIYPSNLMVLAAHHKMRVAVFIFQAPSN